MNISIELFLLTYKSSLFNTICSYLWFTYSIQLACKQLLAISLYIYIQREEHQRSEEIKGF